MKKRTAKEYSQIQQRFSELRNEDKSLCAILMELQEEYPFFSEATIRWIVYCKKVQAEVIATLLKEEIYLKNKS